METVTFNYGDGEYILETGRIARQATSAVMVRRGNTGVLVTLVAYKKGAVNPFFPLSVHYIEKTYAAGRIPGSFFRREAKPGEKEVLTSRLIDRPLRPLFPKEFRNEVQVMCTVLSTDKNVDPDICALLGASAALSLSGLPVKGILGALRVGYGADGQYLLNPTYSQLKDSKLDMVVAGTKDAVLMVESEAAELPEETMLGAVEFAHTNMQTAINAISELTQKAGKPRWEWESPQEKTSRSARENCERGTAPNLKKFIPCGTNRIAGLRWILCEKRFLPSMRTPMTPSKPSLWVCCWKVSVPR